MLRRLIKRWLLSRGAILSRPPGQFDVTEYKLGRAKERGLRIRHAVDGGAHVGDWARMVTQLYPDVRVILVEPRTEVHSQLNNFIRDFPNCTVATVLLGSHEGFAEFHVSSTQSSVLPDHTGASFGFLEKRQVATIDSLVREAGWSGVDLLKLDIQGYELEALAGAQKTLSACQAVILEVSFVRFQQGMPLANDVFEFMRSAGFVIYDILALTHRPLDGRLAQADIMFLRNDHPLLEDNRWSAQGTGFWATT